MAKTKKAHWKKIKKLGCRCVKGAKGHERMVKTALCKGKRKPAGCVKHTRKATNGRRHAPVARQHMLYPFAPEGSPVMQTSGRDAGGQIMLPGFGYMPFRHHTTGWRKRASTWRVGR
jgi:hypothetical protein